MSIIINKNNLFNKKYLAILTLFFLSCFSFDSYAATNAPLNPQLQQLLDNARSKFGASAASMTVITPQTKIPLTFLSGSTMDKNGQPLLTSDLFQIGSTSKSFIATSILLLESQGKLSLNDTLGKWLPEYPNWKNVTIRELLSNSSGIPSYTQDNPFVEEMTKHPETYYSTKDLLAIAYKHPMKFAPGKGWHYCNTNWVLAGLIIEKASGMSLNTMLNHYFFGAKNLNLLNTYYLPSIYSPKIMKRMVHGYTEEGRDVTGDNMSWANAAGAIVSTSQDLATWTYLLFHGKIIPLQQLNEMMSAVSTETGAPVTKDTDSGYGLAVGFRTVKPLGIWWGHEGETLGYHAIFIYYPKQDYVITVLINTRKHADLREFTAQVANMLQQYYSNN